MLEEITNIGEKAEQIRELIKSPAYQTNEEDTEKDFIDNFQDEARYEAYTHPQW